MEEQFFRTGDAAKQLKTTGHLVRRLCETGQIKSRLTASGRRLIGASEIARLSRDGIPPAPSVPMDDPYSGNQVEVRRPKNPSPLIGSPSDEVVKSSEAVLKARNNVEIRRAERELEEENDFFEDRERKREEEEEAALARQAQHQEQQRRARWTASWIDYALGSLPSDLPEEFKIDVRDEVEGALETTPITYSESAIKSLIASARERAIAPYRRMKGKEEAILYGINCLPYSARAPYWQQRVRTQAARGIDQLPEDSTLSDMKATTQEIAGAVTREFNHHQTCESAIQKLGLDLTNSTHEEREDAIEEVRQAVAVLPIGASQRQIQTTAEAALEPFNNITAARRQNKEFRRNCELELIGIDSALDFEGTWQERNQAEQGLKTAFAAMSADSTREQIRATKETILKPFKEVVTNRKADKKKLDQDDHKKRLIGISMPSYLDRVNDYLKELEEEFEIENRISKAYEIRPKLEPVLLAELMKQDMTREEINEFIEDYVDDELDIR